MSVLCTNPVRPRIWYGMYGTSYRLMVWYLVLQLEILEDFHQIFENCSIKVKVLLAQAALCDKDKANGTATLSSSVTSPGSFLPLLSQLQLGSPFLRTPYLSSLLFRGTVVASPFSIHQVVIDHINLWILHIAHDMKRETVQLVEN